VSIDTELEKELDSYQESMGYHTRSEGAIQLLKKGLNYDKAVENLNSEIKKLKEMNSKLSETQNQIHLPCSVCRKPMTIEESDDDPIYKNMKEQYKDWGHSSCINKKGK
jgi:hypothetical protein